MTSPNFVLFISVALVCALRVKKKIFIIVQFLEKHSWIVIFTGDNGYRFYPKIQNLTELVEMHKCTFTSLKLST